MELGACRECASGSNLAFHVDFCSQIHRVRIFCGGQVGLNIFRRFRITELQKADCPPALEHFWSGHAQTHVSERYKKLLQERDYRLEWAEKIGMRFELPKPSIGIPGILIPFRRVS